jgi:hypothetical protein
MTFSDMTRQRLLTRRRTVRSVNGGLYYISDAAGTAWLLRVTVTKHCDGPTSEPNATVQPSSPFPLR